MRGGYRLDCPLTAPAALVIDPRYGFDARPGAFRSTLTSSFIAWVGTALTRRASPVEAREEAVPAYPAYRTMVAFDICGFGASRDNEVQVFVHTALYRLLRGAFDDSGIPWEDQAVHDRGDGALIMPPPQVTPAPFLDLFTLRLRAALRHYNKMASEAAKIRLRMAVHAGQVHFAGPDPIGDDVNHVFRLLEAPEFKRTLAVAPTDLAVLASGHVYDTVIRHGYGLIDPVTYRPLDIECKETRTRAWLNHPSPAMSLVRDQIA